MLTLNTAEQHRYRSTTAAIVPYNHSLRQCTSCKKRKSVRQFSPTGTICKECRR